MKPKMEYNLLKTIERPMALLMPQETLPRLTPFPATDFVNPGLGQISRLYSFYVPLYTQKNIHTIEKQIEVQDNTNLEGSGENSNFNEEKKNEETFSENAPHSNPIEFNDNKRKRMGSPIHESFLHPKFIKTDRILMKPVHEKTTKNEKHSDLSINESKKVKHKFQFV
jgi:hypothetical protein